MQTLRKNFFLSTFAREGQKDKTTAQPDGPSRAIARTGARKGAAAPPPKARPGTVCLWLRGRLPGGRRPLRQRPVSGGKARWPPRRRAWSLIQASQGLVVYVVVVVAIQPAPEIARKAPETDRNGRKEARERPAEHVVSS